MNSIFIIPGRLPGTNEITLLNRRHWAAWAKKKKETDAFVGHCIIASSIHFFPLVVDLEITWIEKDLRRDLDNIAGGAKFILDALVKTGCIKNDSRRFVKSIWHIFPEPEKNNPRIIVEIKSRGVVHEDRKTRD